MGLIVFLVFVFLPAAEIWLLGKVGSILGFWNTFFLLIFSAVFGVYLAKIQGRAVLTKVQQCLTEGRVPGREMLDGLLIFIGGVLFVIPGFITDGIALLLIFPPTRWLIRWWLSRSALTGFVTRRTFGRSGGHPAGTASVETPARPIPPAPSPRGAVQDAEIVE